MKTREEKIKNTSKGKEHFSDILKDPPPLSAKDLSIGPDTGTGEEILKKYLPIIEMVVKKEYKTISAHLAEYGELINVGLITVNKLLNDVKKNNKTYNSSYIAQAVKWAIKDELRSRYNWYGYKQVKSKSSEKQTYTESDEFDDLQINDSDTPTMTQEEATERVFETILYLEDFQREAASREQMTSDELARLELLELKDAIKRAINKLSPKYKRVIELRFYEGKKGNDIANWLGVTPSRVSHMIQDAMEKIRQSLSTEGFK